MLYFHVSIHESIYIMTQLSRNPIHKDVYFEIRDDFVWILSALQSSEETKAFFNDFFTKTERLMFAKRLAIALLLQKGYDYRDIQYLLHVSTSTISRTAHWLDREGNGVARILSKLVREERIDTFLKKIDRFIELHIAKAGMVK